jgi:hypothetical protein
MHVQPFKESKMSLTSIPMPSFNTLAKCATAVYAIEAAFRMILKNKFITVFPDNSYTGRAIHQCLDISQYVLGAAVFFVLTPRSSPLISRIAASVGIALVLPLPLVFKAICQLSPKSNYYEVLDHTAQLMRVGSKLGVVLTAMTAFRQAEPGTAHLLGVARLVGLATALVFDFLTTHVYMRSGSRDFYTYLRGRPSSTI